MFKWFKKKEAVSVRLNNKSDNVNYMVYGYAADFFRDHISEEALRVAGKIRGNDGRPAVIIHGVLPRSGTVYVGELIRLHPVIHAYPNDMWEVPLLRIFGHVINAQEDFFQTYELNRERMGRDDFIPLFGSAVMAYLQSLIPEDKVMLLKAPNVQFINLFFSAFPRDQLILLLRDGRDVVNSFVKSWPDVDFAETCLQWSNSARMIMDFQDHFEPRDKPFWVTTYEYAVDNPVAFIKEFCSRFGLNEEEYPFDAVDQIKVIGSSSLKKGETVNWDPVEKKKDFKPTGKWQTWTAEQKETFKRIAGETLIQAGYVNNNDW